MNIQNLPTILALNEPVKDSFNEHSESPLKEPFIPIKGSFSGKEFFQWAVVGWIYRALLVAVCCSVLKCFTAHSVDIQDSFSCRCCVCCCVLLFVAVCCCVLLCVAVCCCVLQSVATCCSILKDVAE